MNALRKARVPISSEWIVHASFDVEGGQRATQSLLSRRSFRLRSLRLMIRWRLGPFTLAAKPD
jgi:hypothetical protein